MNWTPIDHEKKIQHNKKWMPAMYVAYYGILQDIARKHGYALCVHGSITRDFDLIFVPFNEILSNPEAVISEIKKTIGVEKSSKKIFDKVGMEPHGRTCYTIECGAGGYFDISFTPTMARAMEIVRKQEADRKNAEKIIKATHRHNKFDL